MDDVIDFVCSFNFGEELGGLKGIKNMVAIGGGLICGWV